MNGVVKDYVENYFQKEFIECYLLLPEISVPFKIDNKDLIKEGYFDNIIKSIQSKYKLENIKSGLADVEIDGLLDIFVNNYFSLDERDDCSNLYDYVKLFLMKKGVNNNFSDDMFDHIIKSIVARIWPQYNKIRLNTDEFNDMINLFYNDIYNQYVDVIRDKLDDLLNYKFDIVRFKGIKIDKNKLVDFVSMMIFSREKRIFLKRLNRLTIKPNVDLSRTGIELDKYLKQYIHFVVKSHKQKGVVNGERNVKKVVSQNNVSVISDLDNIRDNSVKKENVPKKIKANKGKKKIDKMVTTLCIIAIMSINTLSANNMINDYVEVTNDRYAIERVEILDDFNYSKSLRNKEYYQKMADNIIKVYSKMGQIENENYKTLSIYEAYESSSGLSEMEDIFRILRDRIVSQDVQLNIRNVINADSEEPYFYLDFVYERLFDMGFDEVCSQKYQDALLRYKYANFGNCFGVVGVYLSDKDSEIINDVMKKYEESCERNKLDFGYLIEEGNYNFFPTYTSSGKGI